MSVIAKLRRPMVQANGRVTSLPAPVKGWNARDSLAAMKPEYAVILENWFPRNTYVQMRHGQSRWATGITGWVETVMSYSGSTTNKLFAAAGTKIYDVTAGGTATSSVTSLTNARWQYVNNTTSGGHYLQAVNGADKMRVFDGTAWHADGDGAPYDVTGVDTATCIGITLAHNRVWLTEVGSLKAWYLPTGSIGGAASALDLSSFCPHGGYLMTIQSWTMDAGSGMDDMTVFITSNGDVLVYSGSDPSSVSTWSLIGVFWVGSPIGRRCAVKWQGDLLVITQDGVQPMSLAMQSSRINARISLTDVIQLAMSEAITNFGSIYGWQLLPYPGENMLILNVPMQANTVYQQYVMNTITQAWCKFTNINAPCVELHLDVVYFGGNGYVGKFWDTLGDFGSPIAANGLQAFSAFGSPGANKLFTNVQFVLSSTGTPSTSTKINLDFDTSDPTAAAAYSATSAGRWGISKWGIAKFGAGQQITQLWQGANGVGKYGAPHISISANGIDTNWMATNVLWKKGGVL